jgi:hypothetical protein
MNNDFLPPRGQHPNRSPQPKPRANDWERPTTFRTPEEIATEDTAKDIIASGDTPEKPTQPKQKKSFKQRLKELTKKQWAIIIVVAVLLLGGIGFAVYHFFIKSDAKPVKQTIVKKETPAAVQPLTSTLTGLPVADASVNKRPVTAVMIENSPDARPQAGLNQAGVVFEAIAEGGITRFLTLFQDTEPDYIGPVRSVRPYYVQWLAGFDAAVAHVGGSADALAMLKNGEAKDLDQFANPGPYHRVSNRYAPHNMYSSIPALRELQEKKGFTSTYNGFPRKTEVKPAAAATVTSIDFNISSAVYNPHYDYDPATNTYKRAEGGKPHLDEKSGQIAPKVVIALTMPQGLNGIYTTYGNLGSGEVHVFQDGAVTVGTWSKPTAKDQITFKDASGAPIKLNPGQTWISVVGSSSRISYK